MTYKTIKYENLIGFSKLFVDFVNGNQFFQNRFPNNKRIFEDKDLLIQISEPNRYRELIVDTISSTMQDISKSPKQHDNLAKIKLKNCLVVATGQQVGFLGGPLYTLIKALSSVSLSQKLSKIHPEFSFAPIFWIEDNDHDNLESSQIAVFGKDYHPHMLNCDANPDKRDRRIVSSRRFDNFIIEVINKLYEILNVENSDNHLISELRKIYQPGKSWTSAFVELMNYVIGETGILFLSASNLQKTGVFFDLAKKEIESSGKSNDLIHFANSILEANNYHIQAKSSKINLFFHKENLRYKIETIDDDSQYYKVGLDEYYKNDLLNELLANPATFSPNVLLRPIFQDYVLPTAAYIAGPSEIGYCTQIKELYDFFQITIPAFLPRHSITLIDRKTQRFLEKYGLQPELFFMRKEDLKRKINDEFNEKDSEIIINHSLIEIQKIFDNLKSYAKSVDQSLEASVDAGSIKTQQLIETIGRKIKSANLRKYDYIINRYLEISDLIFPLNSYQERIYSPINFLFQSEQSYLSEGLLKIFETEPSEHFFVFL